MECAQGRELTSLIQHRCYKLSQTHQNMIFLYSMEIIHGYYIYYSSQNHNLIFCVKAF